MSGRELGIATLRLVLPAKAENVAVIRHALAGMAAELGATAELVDSIKTAVTEAANNVVVHAYPDGVGPIEVTATAWGQRFEIVVRDQGTGMQARPMSAEKPSLRVGLTLIAAMASGFEVRGQADRGTEIRISFDIDPDAEREWVSDRPDSQTGVAGEMVVSVQGSEPGGVALTRVLELLAARSDLPLDRFSDAQMVGDLLAGWSDRSTIDGRPLEFAFGESEKSIEVRVGPLEPGLATELLERDQLPGLGSTLDRLADSAEVSEHEIPAGTAAFITLRLGAPDG